jgi:hypothetical protein
VWEKDGKYGEVAVDAAAAADNKLLVLVDKIKIS